MIILEKEDKELALRNLEELRQEILCKLGEMEQIIRELAGENYLIWERARSYWHTSVWNNLDSESGSFLGSMVNFEDTLRELKEHVEIDEGEGEEKQADDYYPDINAIEPDHSKFVKK